MARLFSATVRFGRSRSSKVIHFGTNRKHVYDFLLVGHSNLGPILLRFRELFSNFPTYVITYLNVMHGQTVGQTDDLLSHNRALRRIAR